MTMTAGSGRVYKSPVRTAASLHSVHLPTSDAEMCSLGIASVCCALLLLVSHSTTRLTVVFVTCVLKHIGQTSYSGLSCLYVDPTTKLFFIRVKLLSLPKEGNLPKCARVLMLLFALLLKARAILIFFRPICIRKSRRWQ